MSFSLPCSVKLAISEHFIVVLSWVKTWSRWWSLLCVHQLQYYQSQYLMYLTVSYQHAAAACQIETSKAEHRRVIFQFGGAFLSLNFCYHVQQKTAWFNNFCFFPLFLVSILITFVDQIPRSTKLYQRPLPQNLSRVCKQCSRPITAQDSVCWLKYIFSHVSVTFCHVRKFCTIKITWFVNTHEQFLSADSVGRQHCTTISAPLYLAQVHLNSTFLTNESTSDSRERKWQIKCVLNSDTFFMYSEEWCDCISSHELENI